MKIIYTYVTNSKIDKYITKEVRGKDIKETVVLRTEDHTCVGSEKVVADYDFQCLWASGVRGWIPYSEASKLRLFEAHTSNCPEFSHIVKSRRSRSQPKKQKQPSIPEKRRRSIQNLVSNLYQYIAGKPVEPAGHNSVPVEDCTKEVPVEEVVEKVTSQFQLKDEELEDTKVRLKSLLQVQQDKNYTQVLQPLKPGEFTKTSKVKLEVGPTKEKRSPPPYPIKDPRAAEAYQKYTKKLVLEGRARELPSGSEVPVSSPPRVVVDYYMEDGSPKWRFTQDARCRNEATTKKPFFSRQTVSELVQKVKSTYKGVCDTKSALFQLEFDEQSRVWTRWICPLTGKVYEVLGVDMGGCSSPGELQDRMDQVLGLPAPYTDDLVQSHNTMDEHKQWTSQVLDLCLQYSTKLAPDKCKFFQFKVEALGRLVDSSTHTLTEETKEKVLTSEKPKTTKDLQHFTGVEGWGGDCTFYKGKFTSAYTKILTEMINENPPKLKWNHEREQAFEDLKSAVASCLQLHFFDPSRKVHMATDASKKGWGGILFYLTPDGKKEVFAVASGSYSIEEQKWSTGEHEAKATRNSLLPLKHYLLGREFILFTDNRNLTFLHNNKADKVHRWACDFAQLTFLSYRTPGKLSWETDLMSRVLTEKNSPEIRRFFDGHI